MITLVAGSDKKEFQTHRAHLEISSAYFRLALKKEWQEGQESKIALEDVDPDLLHRYLHFLYTGKIACLEEDQTHLTTKHEGNGAAKVTDEVAAASDDPEDDPDFDGLSSFGHNLPPDLYDFAVSSDDEAATKDEVEIASRDVDPGEESSAAREEYELWAKLYVLGERFQDGRFKDAVVDAIVAKVKDTDETGYAYYPVTGTINIIYEGTTPGSCARQLMVNIYTTRGLSEWLADDTNTDFLLDLTRNFTALNQKHQSYVNQLVPEGCDFHEHAEGAPCSIGGVKRKREADDE